MPRHGPARGHSPGARDGRAPGGRLGPAERGGGCGGGAAAAADGAEGDRVERGRGLDGFQEEQLAGPAAAVEARHPGLLQVAPLAQAGHGRQRGVEVGGGAGDDRDDLVGAGQARAQADGAAQVGDGGGDHRDQSDVVDGLRRGPGALALGVGTGLGGRQQGVAVGRGAVEVDHEVGGQQRQAAQRAVGARSGVAEQRGALAAQPQRPQQDLVGHSAVRVKTRAPFSAASSRALSSGKSATQRSLMLRSSGRAASSRTSTASGAQRGMSTGTAG